MSGAEVIGLISGTIAIIDAVTKLHSAIKDASGIPSSFRHVARRMPLVKDSLLATQQDIDAGGDESYAALAGIVESCQEKLVALEEIFRAVTVTPGASGGARMVAAARTLSKARRLEELMKGVAKDVAILAANYSIKAATSARLRSLVEDMEDAGRGSAGTPSSISNYGTGWQSVHTGTGHQNINAGSGAQLNGNFAGPFSFALGGH
ncbi:hypothetical protein GGR56DRAFT_676321 [Xylariaceae sp. FL0804]|nr:hypothetical protein GGR56DRAFT_676321 [Xylariaceae sp. FL0804]